MRTRTAWLAVLAFVVLVAPSAARASEHSDDLKARRARMMQRLGPDAMLVLFSAPLRNYSLDVSYEYRQDSNLYYLAGMTEGRDHPRADARQRLAARDPLHQG